MGDTTWTDITTADEVTPEILDAVAEIVSGWYPEGTPMDWDDFLDRLDGIPLADGSRLNLGEDTQSGAVKAIKGHARKLRRP